MESATLYQLRNLINRTSVTAHTEKNVKASEDFLSLIINAHVIAAAKALLLEKNFDNPADLASAIVKKYIRLPRPDDQSKP